MNRVRAWLRDPRAAVFAALLVAFGYFYQAGGWNQNSRFDLTRAIVERGTLRIDAYVANTGDAAKRDGHYYCDKAPAVSLLAVPIYAVSRPIVGESPEGLAVSAWLATVAVIGVPSAIAVLMLIGMLGRLGLSRGWAMVAGLGWGLGTLAWPYSTLLYGHQLVASLLVIALALILRCKLDGGAARRRLWLGLGALFGLMLATDYSAALVIAPVGLLALAWTRVDGPVAREAARAFAWIGLGALGPLAVMFGYHWVAFGGPLTLPYEFSTQKHRHMGFFMGLGAPDPNAIYHLTFSAYRGLFVMAPWLLLALPGAVAWWRHGGVGRTLVVVAASSSLLVFWLNASLVDWQGGWAMGPRYLIPALPMLALLVAGNVWWFAGRGRAIALAVLVALVAGSGVVMLAGTAVRPETPSHIRRPLADEIWPNFKAGRLGISRQGIIHKDQSPKRPPQAWNLGQQVGLRGLASLLPLLVALFACGIWWRSNAKIHSTSPSS